jgi:hypothetical protein
VTNLELFALSEHLRHVTDDRRMPSCASDESLWQASACGDQRAFSERYERHARAIYNYVFRRRGDWSEAEDLTAVVFLEAFRRRKDVVVLDGSSCPGSTGSRRTCFATDGAPRGVTGACSRSWLGSRKAPRHQTPTNVPRPPSGCGHS